ncbi:DUF7701 domain-containing protein [Amycolatopsis mongoliensis]
MSNYLAELAVRIRAALSADARPPSDSDDLFVLYAVLLRAKGVETTLSDVHDAWAAWMSRKDEGHNALVPFSDLDEVTKRQDLPYVAAIRAVAREFGDGG